MWQALTDELADDGRGGGLTTIAIAVDESADDVRPWVEGVSMTVLLDRDRVFCDRYGVTNVPTVLWLDEDNQIVRPNSAAFGDDMFRDFHGIDSSIHHNALRRWVLDDELPFTPDEVVERRIVPSADEQRGRAEFRLAAWLLRTGRHDAGREHLAAAGRLAPNDFTIWRAGLALSGDDPFGARFFELYEAWKARTGGVLPSE